MKRISTSTKITDKFGAGKHGFTDGDVAGGSAATDLEADLFDHWQEEFCNVIEAAGIAIDGSDKAQLLAALRSAGVFQTAPQFDSTTKAATTAFARGVGLRSSGYEIVSASIALTASHAGKSILLFDGGVHTVALPDASTAAPGDRIHLRADYAGVWTINPFAGQSLRASTLDVNVSQILRQGDDLLVERYTDASWRIVGGTVALRYANDFAASLSGNGYQKLPTGLILQWGDSVAGTVNTPVAFPNSFLSVTASAIKNDDTRIFAAIQVLSNSSFSLATYDTNPSAVRTGQACKWQAVGY